MTSCVCTDHIRKLYNESQPNDKGSLLRSVQLNFDWILICRIAMRKRTGVHVNKRDMNKLNLLVC